MAALRTDAILQELTPKLGGQHDIMHVGQEERPPGEVGKPTLHSKACLALVTFGAADLGDLWASVALIWPTSNQPPRAAISRIAVPSGACAATCRLHFLAKPDRVPDAAAETRGSQGSDTQPRVKEFHW